jgi:hypothetical protein
VLGSGVSPSEVSAPFSGDAACSEVRSRQRGVSDLDSGEMARP